MNVNWEALSAIGTIGAVIVSLVLASAQGRKDKKAQRARARWVALELRKAIANWHRRVERAIAVDNVELYFVSEDEHLDPTGIPAEVNELRASLHELGDDISPLADAIWVARQISNIPVREALRGDIADQAEADLIVAKYRKQLEAVERHTKLALERVSKVAGPANAAEAERALWN